MSLFKLDDHYNQTPYRYERNGCILNEHNGQRWNYPWLFNREAKPPIIAFTGQKEHRNSWFIGEKK